jgi:hypothetical protein
MLDRQRTVTIRSLGDEVFEVEVSVAGSTGLELGGVLKIVEQNSLASSLSQDWLTVS